MHFLRLPQEIHLAIIHIMIDEGETLNQILALKLVHRSILNTFRENEHGLCKALSKLHQPEALEFLDMMRPGSLSPTQRRYVVTTIESEVTTRVAEMDDFEPLLDSFLEWKQLSYGKALDPRLGYIGSNELRYLQLSARIFILDYIVLFIIHNNLKGASEPTMEELKRIESAIWLLHILLGHYHRVPLYPKQNEAGKEEDSERTTLVSDANSKLQESRNSTMDADVAKDSIGGTEVEGNENKQLPKDEEAVAVKEDGKRPTGKGSEGSEATVAPDHLRIQRPLNVLVLDSSHPQPHRDTTSQHPILWDDTDENPQTTNSDYTMAFDATYLMSIPIKRHITLSAVLSVVEEYNDHYSWTRNNYTPCKIEHYVHGCLWDRYLDDSKAWPLHPQGETQETLAYGHATQYYYTPQERQKEKSAFAARVHGLVLGKAIWSSGQNELDDFCQFLEDKKDTWRWSGGWNRDSCMRIVGAEVWDPSVKGLAKRDLWVPTAEEFWCPDASKWRQWQAPLTLSEEQSPGSRKVLQARGFGAEQVQQAFGDQVLNNPLLLAELEQYIDWVGFFDRTILL